ncbi:MAG: MFS transporter [Acidiphilium sp.]|nr:MFS transporter [Acidiphilium sp.]MDD4934597.1 MFS transporter [Acidiphilium sp.]
MRDRRFAPLFWCQAFAAFNDNFLKTALAVLILYRANGQSALVALAGAAFVGPSLFVSGIAGQLADRFDKASVATNVKAIEIAAAALAVAGFLLQSIPLLFAALLAFGVLASLFGPVKYGLLPDLLHTAQLPFANALVDFATFLAILLGTALGGLLGARNPVVLCVIVMGFALLAFGAARMIPRPGAARPDLALRANPVAASRDLIVVLWRSRDLFHAALVNTWFWFAGIICLTLLPVMTKTDLHRGPAAVTLGLTVFSIGIGAGSFLAARLMHGQISLRPARIGTVMVGVGGLLVAILATAQHFIVVLGLLFVVSASGGLIAVPSFAAVQAWSDPTARARAVAGTNIISAAAMLAASLTLTALLHEGIGPRAIFAGLGVVALSLGVLARR